MSNGERHPIIDLTDLCNSTDDATANAVIELAVESGWLTERPRQRQNRRRAHNFNTRASNIRPLHDITESPTRIINNEPIVISDSPQVVTVRNTGCRKVTRALRNKNRVSEPNNKEEEKERDRSPLGNFGVCPICLEPLYKQRLVSTRCGHVYCQNCLTAALRTEKKCPTCRKPLKGSPAYHPIYLSRTN